MAGVGGGADVGVTLVVALPVSVPGLLPAAGGGGGGGVPASAFCWFCLACALARLAAEAMMLAVVGYDEGSEPDAGAAAVEPGAGVDVDAGTEVIEGGIDAPA